MHQIIQEWRRTTGPPIGKIKDNHRRAVIKNKRRNGLLKKVSEEQFIRKFAHFISDLRRLVCVGCRALFTV